MVCKSNYFNKGSSTGEWTISYLWGVSKKK